MNQYFSVLYLYILSTIHQFNFCGLDLSIISFYGWKMHNENRCYIYIFHFTYTTNITIEMVVNLFVSNLYPAFQVSRGIYQFSLSILRYSYDRYPRDSVKLNLQYIKMILKIDFFLRFLWCKFLKRQCDRWELLSDFSSENTTELPRRNFDTKITAMVY